jgi:hypothetical protein
LKKERETNTFLDKQEMKFITTRPDLYEIF